MSHKRPHGKMSAKALFSSSPLPAHNSESLISEFLAISEGVAHRWVETRKGILLLVMAPYRPDTGAIYIYDRERDVWYSLDFEGLPSSSFTVELFERVYTEYKLLTYTLQPGLLLNLLEEAPRRHAVHGTYVSRPKLHRLTETRSLGWWTESMATMLAEIAPLPVAA